MTALDHLAASAWPCEDGGPSRPQLPLGIAGPRARTATVSSIRHDPLCLMTVLGADGAVLLLRRGLGPDSPCWVESIDPLTCAVLHRSEDLAVGPFWPGGLAAMADGAIVVVQGRYVHRLGPSLRRERSREMDRDAPHNSFVVLDDGSIALKDLQFPGTRPSVLSVLDPVSLTDRVEPLELPEPSVARLSAADDTIVVVGVDAVHEVAWSPQLAVRRSGTYRTGAEQSYGWDPVITPDHVWFMDNGDHRFTNGFTMLGNGVSAGPVHLWRVDRRSGALASVPTCGLPGGAITNPPLVDCSRSLVVAYDSANAVLAAFDTGSLEQRWARPLRTAQHLVLFPDTGELLANDHDPATGDALAVVDIATGEVTARVSIGSPTQSVVFAMPGTRRDAYYVSMSTVARVEFG